MAKAINQEMHEYFMLLSDPEKKSVLQMIKTFLQARKQAPATTGFEQYNKEIDEAMKRMDEGRFITQEELEKESQKW